jgi:hypothetical protein
MFCELFVEQIRASNCPSGTMSNNGYKIIAQKFLEKCGLWRSTKQLKTSGRNARLYTLFMCGHKEKQVWVGTQMVQSLHQTTGGKNIQR